ncbi:MAG: type II secretion system protein [Planctomycetota bacterium]|jgi:prepilin-type N-terminal cleavage/methylation domain-containing protein
MKPKEKVTIRYNLTNKAFTLIELVIVISIMSILLAVSIPALNKARRSARSLIGIGRQRDTAFAVTLYAQDNDNQYPDSVARPKLSSSSPWREPTIITAPGAQPNRSISTYLLTYIKNANTIFCPGAPRKYEYLQKIWDTGDDWNNELGNQFFGTYCFYWNYVGYLEEKNYPFRGPQSSSDGRQYSKLLTSDYLGFGHWRNVLTYGRHDAYGCCDEFNGAGITKGTPVSADFWSRLKVDEKFGLESIEIRLHTSYTDGHVESYGPSDVMTMKVSKTPDGTVPCPTIGSPGIFYIPIQKH